jgi:O-antigen biosynthesis protein
LKSPASRSESSIQDPPPTISTSSPTVTIVICTRNRPDQLRNCLQAVSNLEPAPTEVLVVDNTSGEPEIKAAALALGARYTIESVPGLSRARNRGLAESNSDVVAFLDDDATPVKNWLALLLAPFADPQVACVTGDTYDSVTASASSTGKPTRFLGSRDPLWFEIANFGGLGYGTNMALRKSSAGPQIFDHRLGRGTPLWIAEESYAFAALIARGYRAAHVPPAIVIHPSKPRDIQREASTSFAYWLLLFFDFPGHRMDLLRFLFRRLLRKKLPWPRDPQEPGEVITSGWRIYVKAGFAGTLLYLRNRKHS